MNRKILLFAIIVGIGTANYFLLRKSKEEIKKEILKKMAIDSIQESVRTSAILDKMTRQELLDVLKLESMGLKENTPKSVTDKIDPAFKQRIANISDKYNIFT